MTNLMQEQVQSSPDYRKKTIELAEKAVIEGLKDIYQEKQNLKADKNFKSSFEEGVRMESFTGAVVEWIELIKKVKI